MSEVIKSYNSRANIRWNLLTSVSGLALMTCVASANAAKAGDDNRPTVWVELGGQMEAVQGTSSPFTAPFMNTAPSPDFYNPKFFISDQKPPKHSFGLEGKIVLQPKDTEWTFTVGARYGRSSGRKHTHYQTRGQMTRGAIYYTSGGGVYPLPSFPPGIYQHAEAFSDLKAVTHQEQLVVDFSVGKDVGIGLFGRDGVSNISGGVRAAEFSQSSTVSIFARPEIDFHNQKYPLPLYRAGAEFNQYTLTGHTHRSFHGVGPSLAWNASADLMGNAQDGELMLDWGVNVALLFGKQKAETDHSTVAARYSKGGLYAPAGYAHIYPSRNGSSVRSRSVTVPNLGGSAAISVKYPNVKVSLGYRADFFFGAVDAGVDARHSKDLGFQGPFATVSIGLGG